MQDSLFIKDGGKLFQVFFSELQYVESAHRYVRFVTADKVYLREGSLNEVENELPADQFCRIHRSYIVSYRHTRQVDARMIIVAGRQLPIGRQYRGILLAKIAMTCTGMKLIRKAINDLFNRPKSA
jgi:DNA-binding LytR/AlgR family response regulator